MGYSQRQARPAYVLQHSSQDAEPVAEPSDGLVDKNSVVIYKMEYYSAKNVRILAFEAT